MGVSAMFVFSLNSSMVPFFFSKRLVCFSSLVSSVILMSFFKSSLTAPLYRDKNLALICVSVRVGFFFLSILTTASRISGVNLSILLKEFMRRVVSACLMSVFPLIRNSSVSCCALVKLL